MKYNKETRYLSELFAIFFSLLKLIELPSLRIYDFIVISILTFKKIQFNIEVHLRSISGFHEFMMIYWATTFLARCTHSRHYIQKSEPTFLKYTTSFHKNGTAFGAACFPTFGTVDHLLILTSLINLLLNFIYSLHCLINILHCLIHFFHVFQHCLLLKIF